MARARQDIALASADIETDDKRTLIGGTRTAWTPVARVQKNVIWRKEDE